MPKVNTVVPTRRPSFGNDSEKFGTSSNGYPQTGWMNSRGDTTFDDDPTETVVKARPVSTPVAPTDPQNYRR